MNFGILKEDTARERRVSLTPAGVQSLVSIGHQVYIEKDAGIASHFTNEQYEATGAKIVYTSDEIFGRSEVVLKVSPPTVEECERFQEGQTLFSFLHLVVGKEKKLELLLKKNVCAIGYELIEDQNGDLPILQVMSEIAGQMATQVAARYLESNANGRGIVMGGITGVPPATVLIIGAGTVGHAAARIAFGLGAEVIMLDKDLRRIRTLANEFKFRIITAMANEYNLKKSLQFADVVIGAILIKAERAPHVVTEEMVKLMKPGAIIVDVSIDQGGCIETSRPTTLENPTYLLHNVIHYCVPNMPANVSRTATYSLTNALLPFLLEVANEGLAGALLTDQTLANGVCTFRGKCTSEPLARRFELKSFDISSLI
jgi:alanine dehydrogenase